MKIDSWKELIFVFVWWGFLLPFIYYYLCRFTYKDVEKRKGCIGFSSGLFFVFFTQEFFKDLPFLEKIF